MNIFLFLKRGKNKKLTEAIRFTSVGEEMYQALLGWAPQMDEEEPKVGPIKPTACRMLSEGH